MCERERERERERDRSLVASSSVRVRRLGFWELGGEEGRKEGRKEMGECYSYPPLSFEPSELPRVRRPKRQPIKVRIMLPMSIVCKACGNHIRQGTKFHSRKEEVVGEMRLGIPRFRFYFKCTKCSAVLTIKTYPQQDPDSVVESGAARVVEENEKRRSEAGEMGHVINPTSDSKREMDILSAAPDEINSMKKRKFSEESPDKPTDSLTKATTSDISNDRGNPVGSLELGV
ncbi:uncharacterized protein LOC115687268 isoform X1 [Syzygium oleosum]|uniref:uncharacterized protein LOC115687268 isoform X1 n=1 Tax=Syzygium oleosum TaxID=219896 RepID=UPI0024BAD09E|nr:uncharacterized protein LOC115687268 isoform X1 [Syzygium oleosum]